MLLAACPNCGAEIRFQSAVMPVKVCEFCRSLIMRNDDRLSLLGEAAVLPDDVSPIQLGTRFEADGVRSTVVGRLRWQWSAGAWNEWLAVGDDGSMTWLGEAMGRFMVLRERPMALTLPAKPEFGQKVDVAGKFYTITDVKTAIQKGAEGELPYAARAGASLLNVDLADQTGHCASVQIVGGRTAAFTGHFSDLEALKPSNLRALAGWPLPAFADD